MADDDKNEDEKQDGKQGAAGKSNKKLIIIIVVVAVLAIALSVGATLFFLKGSKDDAAKTDGTGDSGQPAKEAKKQALYYDIKPPFVVTYDVDGRQRYMQVFLSAMSRDQSTLDKMGLHMPLIRNKLIVAYSSEDFNTLRTDAGRIALQKKSLDTINEVLASEKEKPIEQVYFDNFVLQ